MRAYREAFGNKVRFEVLGDLDSGKLTYHVYVPSGVERPKYVTIEIFTRTHLGDVLNLMPDEVVMKERDGIEFWVLTLESYAVLEATRPDSPRGIGIARFAEVYDYVDWNRVIELGMRLGIGDKVEKFISLVRSFRQT